MTPARAVTDGQQLSAEIAEQPRVLHEVNERLAEPAARVAARMRGAGTRLVVLAGRGSSHNAAQYAKYLFEIENGLPVSLAAPSVLTMYESRVDLAEAAVIGLSQSGQSPDVVDVVAAARRAGALTVALTNDPGSPLAAAAELALVTPAGRERSVPATKTYTAQLLALAMLAHHLAGDRPNRISEADLAGVPGAAARLLERERAIAEVAAALRGVRRCAVVGRGYNRASAFEIALKLQETSYISAQPYGAADFLHGPLALIEPGFWVVALRAAGPVSPSVSEVLDRAQQGGARTLLFEDSAGHGTSSSADLRVDVTTGLPELLSPIAFAVAGQLLALHLALVNGLRPASPRGLNKVTVTL